VLFGSFAKGAPHDGQDTVKTLRTIIWYKRACSKFFMYEGEVKS